MKGRINSFQSLGTVDGPGVRFVVFMQGCSMRCAYCHNPDTWDKNEGFLMEAGEVLEKVTRCRGYFGEKGGITVSGGEPLLQTGFVSELFDLCHRDGIHTALDTAGSILNSGVETLLDKCDLVLLDYKMTNSNDYKKYTLLDKERVDMFLDKLEEMKKPTWLRQVIVKGINDTDENISRLKSVADSHGCIEKVELLPFRKYCTVKYDNLKIDFPFKDIEETDEETIKRLYDAL